MPNRSAMGADKSFPFEAIATRCAKELPATVATGEDLAPELRLIKRLPHSLHTREEHGTLAGCS